MVVVGLCSYGTLNVQSEMSMLCQMVQAGQLSLGMMISLFIVGRSDNGCRFVVESLRTSSVLYISSSSSFSPRSP